jgi:hypothetical protein
MKTHTIKRHCGDGIEETRGDMRRRQIELGRLLANQHGGKFYDSRGTDAHGHPRILVANAAGRTIAEIRQEP